MANEANDTSADVTEAEQGNSSAATQNTEQQIPYSRFKEVNAAKTAAEKRLAELEAADAKRKEAEALANGEFQKVIDDLKPKAERMTALEAALKTYLDAEIADIPEDKRDFIPQGDVTTTLAWVKQAKAAGLFGTPRAPELDAGTRGDKATAPAKLTAAELTIAKNMNLTPEQYAKYKSGAKS